MTQGFFSPASVAVIGASTDTKKLGYVIVKNLVDSKYTGRIYPVNNKATDDTVILNNKVYQDIHAIHEVAELIIISIPPEHVFDELMKCYSTGSRNFVIITAGFKEIGDTQNESLINKFLEMHPDANVLGPNCLGFIDTNSPINASFAASFPAKGQLGFFSQSGALCTAILDWSEKIGMGFSQFVSLGNKNQISENTFLDIHISQNATNPLFFYLESFKDGNIFVKKAQNIQSPIVVLHPGRYTETTTAMQSHTGAIASNDRVVSEALEEAGIIRAYGLEDLMDLMMIFNFYPNFSNVKNVAIVSNAGGPGIITTDCIKDYGLNLAHLSDDTQKRLAEKLPRTANIHNPVDVVGDAMADRYGFALDIVLADPGVDAVIVLLTPQAMTQIDLTAEYVQRLAKQHGKVVVASFMGGKKVDQYEGYLFSYGIPYFDYPERAVWALSKLNLKNKINSISDSNINEEINSDLVHSLNLKLPQEVYSENGDFDIVKNFLPGEKIVMKLISDQMWHKTESGGVKLSLVSEDERKSAFEELTRIGEEQKTQNPDFTYKIQGQQMLHMDNELFLGATRDANFGNVVAFGIGGIYANILNENMIFLDYTDANYILDKIKSSKVGEILSGARGQKSFDLNKIVTVIQKMHEYLRQNPDVSEIDINPLGTYSDELYAIDVKVKR